MPYQFSELLLWSDAELVVINKPAGLPTLPDGYDSSAPCLVALLRAHYDSLWVVHRLDKETSGVILFARTALAHRALNAQFEQRQALKTYHAIVDGVPGWSEKTVSLALRPDGDRRHRSVVDARHGKPALTELRVLKRFANAALLAAQPRTGRTHQIRAHLAATGFPIAGDRLYSRSKLPSTTAAAQPFERTMLHAWQIELLHPSQESILTFEAPYPPDFCQALERQQ
jgi:RluA family pseudouridine synthase